MAVDRGCLEPSPGRLLSLALAAGTLACTYRIALTIFPHAPIIAVAALAVNAFIPMFVFISASVNNDNLVIFLSSVTLLLLVRIVQRGTSRWRLVSLGAVIGLACLTKLSALGLIPLTGLTLLLHVGPGSPLDRRTKLKRWVMDCVVFCLPVVLIAGWWYLRNWQLYGDPTGLNAMLDIVGRRRTDACARRPLRRIRGAADQFLGALRRGECPFAANLDLSHPGCHDRVGSGRQRCVGLATAPSSRAYPVARIDGPGCLGHHGVRTADPLDVDDLRFPGPSAFSRHRGDGAVSGAGPGGLGGKPVAHQTG